MFGTVDNGDDGGRSRGGDHDYGRGDEHEHHHRRRHEARLISGDSCQQYPPTTSAKNAFTLKKYLISLIFGDIQDTPNLT